MSRSMSLARASRLAIAALTVLAFSAPADARVGGGFSTGSRGLKTYTPPPPTRTAPGPAQNMERSAQPAPQAARPAAGQSSAATAAARTAQPSRFGTGFLGGLLGAGLIGGLLGYGFFGMSGLLGFLGFFLQVILIGGAAMMALAWWRGRSQPAMAATTPNSYQRANLNADDQQTRQTAAGATAAPAKTVPGTTPLRIEDADYSSFERLLSVAQLSFGRGDVPALRSATTPEMLGYFTEQLDGNAKRGVRNEVADPKFISGDLAEAWSEASGDYASVAMHYTLMDATYEIASGKIIDGNATKPQDITEIWTFTRRLGGGNNAWRISAIQQVS